MAREFIPANGTGISVTTTENADGSETWTITNTSPGSSVTGTGFWYSASGALNAAAVTLTGDVSQGALSGSNVPLTVTAIQGHGVTLATGYLNWTGTVWAFTTPVTSLTAGTGLTGGGTGSVTISLSVPVSVADGGTGQTSLNSSAVIVGNGAGAVGQVTGSTAGTVLTWLSAGNPAFNAIDLQGINTDLANVLPATLGGTNRSSLTGHAVLIGNSTAQVNFASPSSAGQVLTDNGAGADPSFKAPKTNTNSAFAELNSASSSTTIATAAYTQLLTVTVTVASGQIVLVEAGAEFFNASATSVSYGIAIDSTSVLSSVTHRADNGVNGQGQCAVMFRKTGLSAASHTINLLVGFSTAAGTVAGGSLLVEVVDT